VPQPILPAVFDLTAESSSQISSRRGAAIVQGDSYELVVSFVDTNGDPFNFGPQATPRWSLRAQLRESFADSTGTALASFTCTFTDAPNGLAVLKLTPAQTAAITLQSGRWDIEMVNLTDAGYDVGFVQKPLRGEWSLLLEVTR
jgi:hypothetical protein